MSNSLSNQLLAQIFGQQSNDPFLMLITLEHDSFDTIRLVNNSEDIVSRGDTFLAAPLKVRLPTDDGETRREVWLDLDNAGLEIITELRSVTTPIDVKIEMILASIPDSVQISIEDMTMRDITYTKTAIRAKLSLDDFLNTAIPAEKYDPKSYPGLF